MLGGKVVGALGNVDAVAEDDCGREWGRGRGKLGENATDFALSVDEDVVGPFQVDIVAERFEAARERVANRQAAGVDEPSELVGGN